MSVPTTLGQGGKSRFLDDPLAGAVGGGRRGGITLVDNGIGKCRPLVDPVVGSLGGGRRGGITLVDNGIGAGTKFWGDPLAAAVGSGRRGGITLVDNGIGAANSLLRSMHSQSRNGHGDRRPSSHNQYPGGCGACEGSEIVDHSSCGGDCGGHPPRRFAPIHQSDGAGGQSQTSGGSARTGTRNRQGVNWSIVLGMGGSPGRDVPSSHWPSRWTCSGPGVIQHGLGGRIGSPRHPSGPIPRDDLLITETRTCGQTKVQVEDGESRVLELPYGTPGPRGAEATVQIKTESWLGRRFIGTGVLLEVPGHPCNGRLVLTAGHVLWDPDFCGSCAPDLYNGVEVRNFRDEVRAGTWQAYWSSAWGDASRPQTAGDYALFVIERAFQNYSTLPLAPSNPPVPTIVDHWQFPGATLPDGQCRPNPYPRSMFYEGEMEIHAYTPSGDVWIGVGDVSKGASGGAWVTKVLNGNEEIGGLLSRTEEREVPPGFYFEGIKLGGLTGPTAAGMASDIANWLWHIQSIGVCW